MTAAFVALHVAAHAEGLAAAVVRASEGFLARVAVAVDSETARSREGLAAGLTDVTVLRGGKGRLRRGGDVVMVLPGVGVGGGRVRDVGRQVVGAE